MRIMLLLMFILSWQVAAKSKTLRVAVNFGPPWAFYQEGSGVTGIDVEIIRHILSSLGYESEFHLLGYSRLIKEFNEGKYDVASPAAFTAENGYLTKNYQPFHDVAVSLRKHKHRIDTIADLKGKNIIAYQFARSVLGDEFDQAVNDANYLEVAERELQLKLLVNDRTDVVIGERRLLNYIMQQHFPDNKLTVHPIFVAKSYGAIIKDPHLQQQFDRELLNMQANGVYQQILSKWP
ncbi:amino acid ABC transporter substrate-binding protein, PAAT family [Arsukibacterium tuosuense]|uniref:Amino acid ABC transporter substrate-binding protein, PAAT family n=1 Tax=Arsukibacterium tuosuense TaxID=1323745 RepID=A0A285IWQ6_9GAMM|nr:transporter substrate-binding domain-containing protein [Arsukibacterium tuosuense]SNY52422.1 amino acid ABC transporter substrate-binding protein, PAAT family [Arsukibacterium tuosuense]